MDCRLLVYIVWYFSFFVNVITILVNISDYDCNILNALSYNNIHVEACCLQWHALARYHHCNWLHNISTHNYKVHLIVQLNKRWCKIKAVLYIFKLYNTITKLYLLYNLKQCGLCFIMFCIALCDNLTTVCCVKIEKALYFVFIKCPPLFLAQKSAFVCSW